VPKFEKKKREFYFLFSSQRISEVENVLEHEVAKYYTIGPNKDEAHASFVTGNLHIKRVFYSSHQ
jgi:hypothetical protein